MPISTMAAQGVHYLCQKSSHIKHQHCIDLNFGVPSHFKNQCDGAQAHARSILDKVAKKETVSTIPKFIESSRRVYEEFVADRKRAPRLPATWHDFYPCDEKEKFVAEFCKSFKSASFKEQISVCQSWSCRLNDIRRRKNPLYENAEGQLPALDFKAAMLRDGTRVPADRSCHPVVIRPGEVDAAGADGEDGEAAGEVAELGDEFGHVFGEEGNGEISMGTTLHLGWQCSYRSSEPEKKCFSVWRKRFSKARKNGRVAPQTVQAARQKAHFRTA